MSSKCAPRTSSTRPASGPTELRSADGARTGTRPTGCRASDPSRGTHVMLRHEDLPLVGGAIVPAGSGRTIFALPWLGRTLVGTTDNDYEGQLDHVQPLRGGHRLSARGVNEFFGDRLRTARSGGRLRRRATPDLERRPEEVGRHLAQGRAVRDRVWDDHDHRRQADDLAADGQDDRRSSRRARRARRALPHPRDPARAGDRRRGAPTRGGRAGRVIRCAGRPVRPRRPRGARARGERSDASWPSRSSRACPTCSPRSRSPPVASRRAASATCCCAAPAWGCWPRGSWAGWATDRSRGRRAGARAGLGRCTH